MQNEERVHGEAIAWLVAQRGYEQVFEDPDEATNARMDSIGRLGPRPCFIEVKGVPIRSGEVRHIESKLSGSFRGHADESNNHPQFVAMREIWDGTTLPLVATIAEKYTPQGLVELVAMLEKRSKEWAFDFEVWEWTGSELKTLAEGVSGVSGERDSSVAIEIVDTPKSKRSKNATQEELCLIATQHGVGELFGFACDRARSLALLLERRVDSVTLTPRRGTGWVRLLPKMSSSSGLVVECVPEMLPALAAGDFEHIGSGRYSYERFRVGDRSQLEELLRIAAETAVSSHDPNP